MPVGLHLTRSRDDVRVNPMAYPLLLHAKHRDADVIYQPIGPWIVPWRFQSLEREYRALQDGVGLIDDSTWGCIEVQGADRATFLHRLLSNDITRLAPGQGCEAALLSPNAKLIAVFLVLVDVSSIWLLCDADRTTTVLHALERYHCTEQVSLIDHERQTAVLALQGRTHRHA